MPLITRLIRKGRSVILNWRKNLWSLWVGCLISSSSYTMIVPFLPLYLFELGANPSTISLWSGVIFSATFFISAVMSPYWGRRADKSGKKKMLLRAGFSLATVYLLGAFVRSPVELLGVRVLQGVATGFVPASLAIVASSVPENKMGHSLGLMQAATLTGTIIGPLFGGILSHIFGIRASFLVAGVILMLGTVMVLVLVKEPAQKAPSEASSVINDIKIVLNNSSLLVSIALLVATQMSIMLLQPVIALYIAEILGGAQGVGLTSGIVFSLAGIAGALAAPLWGRLGQRIGFTQVLIVVFIGAGTSSGLFYLTSNIWSFAVLQFIFGFFIAGVNPIVNSIAVFETEPCFRGRIFGVMMSANQFGSMIGPLIGGVISVWIGIKMTFLSAGLFLICVALAQGYLYMKKSLLVHSKTT